MLISVQPDPISSKTNLFTPDWLRPLIDGTVRGMPVPEAVTSVVHALGFESMVYGATSTGDEDERVFVWTTAPAEWVREYDQNSYIEIDPRVRIGWDLPLPFIWDASICCDNCRATYFLERAACFGIGSGVALYFINDSYAVMVSLNRPERFLTPQRRQRMESRMGDSLHFASVFHWLFMRQVIMRGLRPLHHGTPLSPRELECVQFAAHGMTSHDIAIKLGIAERTANFHFSNLISKLGVLNRHEAIATAVARGLVRVESMGDAKRSAYFAKAAERKARSAKTAPGRPDKSRAKVGNRP